MKALRKLSRRQARAEELGIDALAELYSYVFRANPRKLRNFRRRYIQFATRILRDIEAKRGTQC